MTKRKGNVMDVLSVMVVILALTILMLGYLNSIRMVSKSEDVSQVARKYILRMETVGYLTSSDKTEMLSELNGLGVTNINLTGTTLHNVGYGNPITLKISGKIHSNTLGDREMVFVKKEFPFTEIRMSTAKN